MNTNKKAAPAGTGTAERIAFDGEILAEIEKNSREVYRVMSRTFKGYQLADVRVWFDDQDTGEPRPGKGVSIKVEALPEIVKVPAGMIEGAQR